MGQPVKVLDLAKRMVELSGLRLRTPEEPDGDIELVITGLRPGEKLYEELLIGENPATTEHPRIMMANEAFMSLHDYRVGLETLKNLLDAHNIHGARSKLDQMVVEYQPAPDIVDYLAKRPTKVDLRVVSGSPKVSSQDLRLASVVQNTPPRVKPSST